MEASDTVFEEGPRVEVFGSSRKQWGQGMASGVVVQFPHFRVCVARHCGGGVGIGVKENRTGCPPDKAGLAKGWAKSGLVESLVSGK